MLLGEALPYSEKVVILDDLPYSINNVSVSDSHDMSSLPPITDDHISVLDFPESQHELLALIILSGTLSRSLVNLWAT